MSAIYDEQSEAAPVPGASPSDLVQYVDKALASMGDTLMEFRLECLKLAQCCYLAGDVDAANVVCHARRYMNFVLEESK